eukprot:scaffold313_cov378-Pavlova_lutheri.AAC.9
MQQLLPMHIMTASMPSPRFHRLLQFMGAPLDYPGTCNYPLCTVLPRTHPFVQPIIKQADSFRELRKNRTPRSVTKRLWRTLDTRWAVGTLGSPRGGKELFLPVGSSRGQPTLLPLPFFRREGLLTTSSTPPPAC